MLQVHPCYIIKFIDECYFKSMSEFIRFIKAIYPPVFLPGNKRSIHLLTCLANDLIKIDIPNMDLGEIHKAIRQTYFYQIFRIIFKSQSCNLKCVLEYVDFIIKETAKDVSKVLDEEESNRNDSDSSSISSHKEEQQNDSMSEEDEEENSRGPDDRAEEAALSQRYCLDINPNKQKEKALIAIVRKITKLMESNLQQGKRHTNQLEGKSFSQEILWLLQQVKKAINRRVKEKGSDEVGDVTDSVSSLIICNGRNNSRSTVGGVRNAVWREAEGHHILPPQHRRQRQASLPTRHYQEVKRWVRHILGASKRKPGDDKQLFHEVHKT